MARQGWSKKEARAIQDRLRGLVKERFSGVRARFIEASGLTRDTVGKWFGRSFRVPDTRTLGHLAQRCGVSLDWLVLGRGGRTSTAKVELYEAVERNLRRRGDRETLRALRGLGNAPEALWQIVVEEVAELPALQDVVEDVRRFRDDVTP